MGAAGGAVVGNAAGLAVGVGEGAAAAAAKPFTYDPTVHKVRQWRTETTPDGRVISVPEEYLVDANGKVIKKLN